jgi:hypothetical protein
MQASAEGAELHQLRSNLAHAVFKNLVHQVRMELSKLKSNLREEVP